MDFRNRNILILEKALQMNYKIVLTVFFMTYSILSFCQKDTQDSYYQIAFDSQVTLSQLADKVYDSSVTNNIQKEKFINSYKVLDASQKELFNNLDDIYDKEESVNKDYLKTLKESTEILKKSIENKDIEKTIAIFDAVALDYKNKSSSFKFGIKTTVVDKIKVKVETPGHSGYFAYIKYSYDFDNDIKRYTFNNPTNNAERYLAPGYYIIWIEKGDFRSEERNIEVVNTDEGETVIYFHII